MLTRLHIDNYRTFEAFTWRPEKVAILIGRNGSGKSSLFDLLHLVRAFVSDAAPLSACFPADSRARWSSRGEQVIELDVVLATGTFTYRLELFHPSRGEGSRISRETLRTSSETLFEFERGTVRLHDDTGAKQVEFKASQNHSALAAVVPDASNIRLTAFKDWLAGIQVVRPNPAQMQSRAPEENQQLASNLENFASWYRYTLLNQPQDIAAATAAFTEIVPAFRSMSMRVDEQRVGWLRANFDGPADAPYALLFEELSDGQRVLFALYVLLHIKSRSGLLVLDEPDNFVALEEIQPFLLELLDRALQGTGAQLFLASHHPEYLDQLAPSHGWVLDRKNGHATTIGRFTADVALSASSLVARGELPTTNET